MKKLLIILGAIVAILLVAAIALPILFKDDIQKAIDQAIAENVNADVYYDIDQFSLSLIKNFPDATVSLGDFGVVNRAPFAGDTLLAVDALNITVDLKSFIFGDQPRISGITLDRPNVYVSVLEDGRANYDITIASDAEETATDTTSSDVAFTIDHWEINDGNVVYQDLTLPMVMAVRNMNHRGSGDFTLDVFDMQTNTEIDRLSVNYDGIEYLTDKKVIADADLNINLEESVYTFLENTFRVNDFALGLDGYVAMPSEDIDMDLSFAAKDNSFKGLLSLVPGMYLEGFEDVQTEGTFDFGGFVKGTYNDTKMPAFQMKLLTENARFQYPDLPTPVTNIAVDLLVDNTDGIIDNTVVNVKSFHADLGNNPIDGRFLLEGLSTYKIDTEVKAKLNLAELMQLYPMDSLELRGTYDLNLVAQGVYDSTTQQIPTIDMDMALQNGYVKSGDYPPLEDVRFTSTVKNETGQLAQTVVRVHDFDMTLADEPFHADLVLTNLDDYTWDVAAKGTLDLEKLTRIYPLEGTQLSGIIRADIQSEGKMSDVEAERYAQLPTSGTMEIRDLNYVSEDLPQGMKINQAQAAFNPERITLQNFEGAAGNSDMRLTGYLSNYLGYALADNETLRGQLDLKSGKFDLNEWMTEDEGATPVAEEDTAEAALEVVEVPKNIDFEMNANIAEVLYDNMTLNNMDGKIVVRDGMVRMDNLDFTSLGGQFAMSGTYDTRDLKKPSFDFDLDIANIAIRQAYQSFNTVQALAPIAQNMNGDMSTKFSIAGLLLPDMSPALNTVDGKGVLDIEDAAVEDSKVVGAITAVTKLSNTKSIAIKDTQLQFEIKNGRVFVQPFDVNVGNFKTVIAGSNGIDGSLDYDLKMTVPAGSVGTAVNSAIAKLTGGSGNVSSDIVLNLGLGGTYDDPKVTLGGAEAGQGAKESVKVAVKEKVAEQKEKLEEKVDQKKEEAEAIARQKAEEAKKKLEAEKKEAEQKAKAEAERLKKEAEEKANEAKEEVKDEAKKKLKKLFPPR